MILCLPNEQTNSHITYSFELSEDDVNYQAYVEGAQEHIEADGSPIKYYKI
jgi:hypothetical protein